MPVKKAAPLARPAVRYWQGKAPKGVSEARSDSEDEEQDDNVEGDVAMSGEQDILNMPEEQPNDWTANIKDKVMKTMNVSLKDVNISEDGKVIIGGCEELGRTAAELDDDESGEDTSDGEGKPSVPGDASDESSEYETDSEDEKPSIQFRPVFVPKRNRATVLEKEALAQDAEQALLRKEQEAEERRKQSHDLVAESIRRELAEKEKAEEIPDLDDTDGLDPAGEFDAWRLRELGRIKKEKEKEALREEEREEVERRRALPEEQRNKEDIARAQKLRDEKPKNSSKFLQKYYHKGAFYQDDDLMQRHDFTQATESTIDVSLLPEVMQVRNFGKRSRTKYTHLVNEDTTDRGVGGFGQGSIAKIGGGTQSAAGCFLCGGPHLKRDCPQNTGPLTATTTTGSNSTPVHDKGWGGSTRSAEASWKERDNTHRYPGNVSKSDHGHPRARSRDRDDLLDNREKRRRVD